MTERLLWLDGDPTDGRRARVPEPGNSEPSAPAAPPPPPPAPPRGGGRFRAALAGGLVSATLVGGTALGLGLVGSGGAPAPAASLPPAPASTPVSAAKQGDVAA